MRLRSGEISRRTFLQRAAVSATALQALPRATYAIEPESVQKVHVIFKTHLDIGFTDLAANVVEKYLHHFIPVALRLARDTRAQHIGMRFKWTTGAWLIHTFLEQMDAENRRSMEKAIEAGDIGWHAMPFTTHSEALDASLFEAGLQLSKRLDERFGLNTLSAKMTDVPGHTRGIVPLLKKAGVKLLHIGVNPASTPPDVPPLFIWKAPDGSQITVMYQKDYGGVMPLPKTNEAVAMMFTGDNHGPQTVAQVTEAYHRLQAQFPEAEIVASDLNQVASTVSRISEHLPVITAELGDSWIHGVGSDPLKMAQLRELSRLRKEWMKQGLLEKHSDTDLAFSIPLCMVGEHTWGLDVKTHLQAWDIYTPEALAAARSTSPFQRIEASWQEKRNYLLDAVNALPESLRDTAKCGLDKPKAARPNLNGYRLLADFGALIETPCLKCAIDPITGALNRLENRRTGQHWASPENLLGLFAYQIFAQEDYDRFMNQYLTSRPDWALKDFGKPGLEAFARNGRTHLACLKAAWQQEDQHGITVLAELEVLDETETPIPGCPRQLFIEYRFHNMDPALDISLQCFGKQANRLPEALWFSFLPVTAKGGAWFLDKMGQDVNPGEVVNNGGHKIHAVADTVHYSDEHGALKIETLDALLAAPGERSLLNFDNVPPPPEKGMHFCLCNNVWGTNFVMWFEDDMQFRFRLGA